jgi:hypothetical protein
MRFFDCHAGFGTPERPGLVRCRTAEELLAEMDRHGIERALVRHEALRTDSPVVGNEVALAACRDHPRLVPTWAILPPQTGELPSPAAFVQRMRGSGVRAVWMLPEAHRYVPDRVSLGPLVDALVAARVPVLLPLGELGWQGVHRVMADFSKLTAIVTGHGSWGDDRLFRPLMETYEGFHIDTSLYVVDQGLELGVRRYGPERFVFSTGYPSWIMGGPVEMLRGAPISDAAKDAIAHGNLERLLSWAGPMGNALTPTPIDTACRPTQDRLSRGKREPSDRETRRWDRRWPVVDLHGHFGPYTKIWFPSDDADGMLRTMDRCGVRVIVCSHHTAIGGDPHDGNRRLREDALEPHPDRFLGYYAWNPYYADEQARDLESFPPHPGFVGFKAHPSWHGVPLTHEGYRPMLEYAEHHRVPILSHTWGGSATDGPAVVSEVAERYPSIPLLLGHGLYGDWDEAVRVARAYPNTYLELTAAYAVAGVVEKYVHKVGSHRVVFGTDLPWYDPLHEIGCILYARISDDDRENILYRNAARIFPAVAERLAVVSR